MEALLSRFDWYEATFDGWDDAASSLQVVLGGELRRERGRNGYGVCSAIVRGDDELVRVYGHSARVGELHAVVTGESCDEVVPVVRRLWPEHRVSRADSSVDFLGEFEEVDGRAITFARGVGLAHRLVTDSAGGATRYLGAPSSEMRVRVYKKSEQLRALHPERAETVPSGVLRAECQARPSKREAKAAAATMTADDVWGLSRWGQAFALEMLGVDAERTSTHFRRPSSWSRALHFLAVQYGPLVRERAAMVGVDVALGELVEALGLE